jgi:ligand-binding sensor domain-containing protein
MFDTKRLLLLLTQSILIIAILFVLTLWLAPGITKPSSNELQVGWQIIRPHHDASALAIQGDIVWTGGKDGVFALNRSNGQLVKTLGCDPPPAYVHALLAEQGETLWIGHQAGLTRYDGNSCHIYTGADSFQTRRSTLSYGITWADYGSVLGVVR